MKLNHNQSGMGVVEMLLILVVVGILGFTGWFVWQSQQKTNDTFMSANNSQAATFSKDNANRTTNQEQNAQYLVVKEWNVKVPVSDINGLSYAVKDKNTVLFSSAYMKSLCAEPGSNAVIVQRGQDADSVDAEVGAGRTFAKLATESPDQVYAKVGNYYYVQPDYRGASCSATQGQESNKETADIVAIRAAVQKMIEAN